MFVEADARVLLDKLRSAFASPNYQPPVLPAVGMQLMELTQRDPDFGDIERLLQKDPMIAARVLSVAQSARYASAHEVRTLRQALTRIGLGTMAQIFLQVVMQMRVFRCPGYEQPMKMLHRHCTVTAMIAAAGAKLIGEDTQEAFLCGLLHDVGMAAALIMIAPKKRGREPRPVQEVWPAIRFMHEEAAARLGKLWKLPQGVTDVISSHHGATPDMTPINALVCLADGLATTHRAGVPMEVAPHQSEEARQILQMNKVTLGRLDRLARDAAASVPE